MSRKWLFEYIDCYQNAARTEEALISIQKPTPIKPKIPDKAFVLQTASTTVESSSKLPKRIISPPSLANIKRKPTRDEVLRTENENDVSGERSRRSSNVDSIDSGLATVKKSDSKDDITKWDTEETVEGGDEANDVSNVIKREAARGSIDSGLATLKERDIRKGLGKNGSKPRAKHMARLNAPGSSLEPSWN